MIPLKSRLLQHEVKNIIRKKAVRDDATILYEYNCVQYPKDLKKIESSTNLAHYLYADPSVHVRRHGSYFARFTSLGEYELSLSHLLFQNLKKFNLVLEIGSGSGRRLAALRAMGFEGQLIGVEISPNGVLAARAAEQKFKLDISYLQGDFRNINTFTHPLISNIGKGDAVFSFLALEQLPLNALDVVNHLEEVMPLATKIFFESGANLGINHYSYWLSRLTVSRRDYLRNFSLKLKKGGYDCNVTKLLYSQRVGNEIARYTIFPRS